jgi:hypothetical protein
MIRWKHGFKKIDRMSVNEVRDGVRLMRFKRHDADPSYDPFGAMDKEKARHGMCPCRPLMRV